MSPRLAPGTGAVVALTVGWALVACSPALAVGPRGTTVSVSCGSGVVVSQPATCTATVTDTDTGTPSTPTGTVSFGSNSEGTFNPSTTCELSPLAEEQSSSCSVEYTPTKLASGTHEISAAYGGDAVHAAGSGSSMLAVSAPPIPVTTGGTTPVQGRAPAPAPPQCRVIAKERWRLARGAKRRARK